MDRPSRRKVAIEPPEDACFCLDLPASDQKEREEETAQQLSMSSALGKHHIFRDPFPAIKSIVQVMETHHYGGMSAYHERIARLDASQMSRFG